MIRTTTVSRALSSVLGKGASAPPYRHRRTETSAPTVGRAHPEDTSPPGPNCLDQSSRKFFPLDLFNGPRSCYAA